MDKKACKAYAEQGRITRVKSVRVQPASEAFPLGYLKDSLETTSDEWVVTLETVTGLDQPTISFTIFQSREEARKYAGRYCAGKIVDMGPIETFDILDYGKASGVSWRLFEVNLDELFCPCYEALVDSGVKDRSYNTCQNIISALSKERKEQFVELFGENWQCAFEFEYVISRFPRNSIPYYAALVFFHYFITYDDVSVAYYWREMKFVISNAEQLALKSKTRYDKAGKRGGERSQLNRDRRIVSLLRHMHRLRDENPALARLGARAIAELAMEDAAVEHPTLWRQGKGRITEYLDEMKADHRYRDKFLTFLKKAA